MADGDVLIKYRQESETFGSTIAASRVELEADLLEKTARISPKYFYNALGSKLFEAICQLDEYYLSRIEAEIFTKHAEEIKSAAGENCTLIDLGAGNCAKAARLFPALQPCQYVPVDISTEFLTGAVAKLQLAHPHIPMLPVGLDFSESFVLPPEVQKQRRLFFYPGSSIGNFTLLQAAKWLKCVHGACRRDGAILIGVDIVKDADILEAAYDDALGVTASFNLNILRHVNSLLLSNFDVRNWRHVALYNAKQSRIEMHLQARDAHRVTWPGGGRNFAIGERIHTENSYKFTQRGFVDLLAQSGFGHAQCWTDEAKSFLVCHAQAI